jgi:hypothetical protein
LPDVCRGARLGRPRAHLYVSSSEQLAGWLAELGIPAPPVRPLPIREVVPAVAVEGPVPGLAEQVRDLHRRFYRKDGRI